MMEWFDICLCFELFNFDALQTGCCRHVYEVTRTSWYTKRAQLAYRYRRMRSDASTTGASFVACTSEISGKQWVALFWFGFFVWPLCSSASSSWCMQCISKKIHQTNRNTETFDRSKSWLNDVHNERNNEYNEGNRTVIRRNVLNIWVTSLYRALPTSRAFIKAREMKYRERNWTKSAKVFMHLHFYGRLSTWTVGWLNATMDNLIPEHHFVTSYLHYSVMAKREAFV